MINKKGQGMSINAVVLIVMAVLLLVILVIGFIIGWDKMLPWLGGKNNIETISTSCNTACSKGVTYDFCTVKREVKDGINEKFEATCNELSSKPEFISRAYGIEPCHSITCPN